MGERSQMYQTVIVALRKESVDRNYTHRKKNLRLTKSLSARRAWIEIFLRMPVVQKPYVALRKESVDRNTNDEIFAVDCRSRSPQGERG